MENLIYEDKVVDENIVEMDDEYKNKETIGSLFLI
jgi:hypothetical protein